MSQKKVSFIATKYKKRKTRVSFHTKEGERVSFNSVKRVPARERVEFVVVPKQTSRAGKKCRKRTPKSV